MSMIRHEVLTHPASILRLYRVASEHETPPFQAVCTVAWLGGGEIELKGFHGRLTRSMLRDLLGWLEVNEVRIVRAHRDSAHSLPFAREQPDGTLLIEVADLIERFTRRTESTWGALGD